MTAKDLRTRRWQEWRAAIIPTLPPYCAKCGDYVDVTLSGRDPMGPTLDHTRPRGKGGRTYDRNNVRLMHLRCNASKGDRAPEAIHSRNW